MADEYVKRFSQAQKMVVCNVYLIIAVSDLLTVISHALSVRPALEGRTQDEG